MKQVAVYFMLASSLDMHVFQLPFLIPGARIRLSRIPNLCHATCL